MLEKINYFLEYRRWPKFSIGQLVSYPLKNGGKYVCTISAYDISWRGAEPRYLVFDIHTLEIHSFKESWLKEYVEV